MWLWWWAGARFATYGAAMVTNTSKVEARRRVREAQARANEARAQRERANVEDAATFMVATGRVSEVDAWESERLAEVREQVRAEANRRRGDHRAEAGGAVARMQQRGETLTTIAELAGVGVGELRAMLRYAPKTENHTAGDVSGALGGDAGSPAMPLRAQPRSPAMWCPALRLVCRWATVMPLARSAPVGYRPGGANRWHATNVVRWGVACTRLRGPCGGRPCGAESVSGG